MDADNTEHRSEKAGRPEMHRFLFLLFLHAVECVQVRFERKGNSEQAEEEEGAGLLP